MQDRPWVAELLAAIQRFLERDVVPALDGPKQFHARVAANVLAIVGRELADEEASLGAEWQRLATLLGETPTEPPRGIEALRAAVRAANAALAERIRRGDADEGAFGAAVRRAVRETVVEKLRVANPRFLGS
ncbi:MAG TPA: DUF6285 domain-containing protein [Candidatus Binatia bacterium]|nr:DUF6285 domain-containing protein [Candidatus Binatia bacterium]